MTDNKLPRVLWTRDQLLVAFMVYLRLPFGQLSKGNKEIVAVARAIGRTPSALALKTANFASLDPAHRSGCPRITDCQPHYLVERKYRTPRRPLQRHRLERLARPRVRQRPDHVRRRPACHRLLPPRGRRTRRFLRAVPTRNRRAGLEATRPIPSRPRGASLAPGVCV